jgi:hypothetical protein
MPSIFRFFPVPGAFGTWVQNASMPARVSVFPQRGHEHGVLGITATDLRNIASGERGRDVLAGGCLREIPRREGLPPVGGHV